VIEQAGDTMKVYFGTGVKAIAPGQAAVFYEENDIIGGGWIMSSFRQNPNHIISVSKENVLNLEKINKD
jgi:tRNA-uridine 2-sulfurtransferase